MESDELLAEIALWTLYVLLAVAAIATTWSVVHSLRRRGHAAESTRGVPSTRIALVAAGLLVGSLAVTFALASTQPLLINGEPYADAFWLRVTDMFIGTLAVMLLVALVGVGVGASGWLRNRGLNYQKRP